MSPRGFAMLLYWDPRLVSQKQGKCYAPTQPVLFCFVFFYTIKLIIQKPKTERRKAMGDLAMRCGLHSPRFAWPILRVLRPGEVGT